jgi:hypothetical protein
MNIEVEKLFVIQYQLQTTSGHDLSLNQEYLSWLENAIMFLVDLLNSESAIP